MPVIATDFPRLSGLIKNLDTLRAPELFSDVVSVTDSTGGTYKLGTLMGQITVGGQWAAAIAGDTYTKLGIYIGTGDALGAPMPTVFTAGVAKPVLALVRGKCVVAAGALILDASFNSPAWVQGAYDGLKAQGILVEATTEGQTAGTNLNS